MLFEVVWVCGAGPVHQIQINIVQSEALQRAVNALWDALMPWIVQLSGDPDFLPRDARGLDALADLLLVAIRKSTAQCELLEPILSRRSTYVSMWR